nr:hypothetical protein [Deinococcus detaillensis]
MAHFSAQGTANMPAATNKGSALNPSGFLATQDLKDRGWTPRLIAEFLGDHDQTRPNGLKMGRRRLPPVKLYLETRVEEAEREETFLLAQHRAMQARERAEVAKAARQAKRAALLDAAAERYTPVIVPEALRKGAVKKARAPYLEGLEQLLTEIKRGFAHQPPDPQPEAAPKRKVSKSKPAKPKPLSESEEKDLRAALLKRLEAALAGAYEWFPDPYAPDPKAKKGKGSIAKPADWRKWDWD